MLKPSDLRNRTFKKNLGGYNAAEIDEYLGELLHDYERLYTENATLSETVKKLAAMVAAYKKDEEAIKIAVDNVKLLCDSLIMEANEKSESIMQDTISKRDEILSSLDRVIKEKRGEIKKLNDDIKAYKEKLVFHYKIHYDSIIKLPLFDSEDMLAAVEEAEQRLRGIKNEDITIPVVMTENASENKAEPQNEKNDKEQHPEKPNESPEDVNALNYDTEKSLNDELYDEEEIPIESSFKDDIRFGEDFDIDEQVGHGLFGRKKKNKKD
ncbi:MAG: DivIVA domain-containing protein [Bacillota bacterium]|nr:DivIVA domain-containing protein [Bacillota bacterium]